MSDDLISRKALMEAMKEIRFDNMQDLKVWIEAEILIERAPVAFDKEKVIEELEEMQDHSESCKNQCEFASTEYFDYMGAEVAYKTAVEIVEKGGIE